MKKNNDIKIIAEIAQGYEGSYVIAKKLLLGAIRSGADAVKFQLVIADELCTKKYLHYQFFKKLKIHNQKWKILRNLAKKK